MFWAGGVGYRMLTGVGVSGWRGQVQDADGCGWVLGWRSRVQDADGCRCSGLEESGAGC